MPPRLLSPLSSNSLKAPGGDEEPGEKRPLEEASGGAQSEDTLVYPTQKSFINTGKSKSSD